MSENPFADSPKDSYCTIYIVRHGQTDWNVLKKIQGQTNKPLNEVGIAQAKEISKKLQTIHVDAVFSSDLARAKQTAEVIALERKLVVITKEALGEKNYAELEGQDQKIIIDLFTKFQSMTNREIYQYRSAPHAETDDEVMSRLISILREIAIGYKGKTVLIVSHHAIMRLLLVHLGYASYTELLPGSIQNTGILTVLSDGIDFFLKNVHGVDLKKHENK